MLYIPSYFTSVSDVPLFTDNNKSFCFNRIEHAARTCYKSEIKEGDYTSSFLNRIYESRHLSVFEHSNFVIRTKTRIPDVILNYTLDNINRELRLNNEHGTSHVKYAVDDHYVFFGGNLRAWLESLGFLKDNVCFCDITPTQLLARFSQFTSQDFVVVESICEVPASLRRYSVQIVHDRAFTHELVRHRVMSFSQESQRYCNYNQGRFGGRVTFIEPACLVPDWFNLTLHKVSCWVAEKVYLWLLRRGVQAQIARSVLPNATKTEIFVSGDRKGWEHLFSLRTSAGAHPDMKSIITRIKAKFQELDSWSNL